MQKKTAKKPLPNGTKFPLPRRLLTESLAQQCFRNTTLEDLHAGITPDSQTGDYTNVVARSTDGETPWQNVSRLSDEQMKALMIDVVNKTYHALINILAQRDLLPCWNEPSLTTTG